MAPIDTKASELIVIQGVAINRGTIADPCDAAVGPAAWPNTKPIHLCHIKYKSTATTKAAKYVLIASIDLHQI
jgi:hypothetical protein